MVMAKKAVMHSNGEGDVVYVRHTILLADIDAAFRAEVQRALEATGRYTVVGSTGDGAAAVRMIQELKPDLVLLDLLLPALDGLGVLERAHQEEVGYCGKFIIISRFVNESYLSGNITPDVVYYMVKPCDIMSLVRRVDQCFHGYAEQSMMMTMTTMIPAMVLVSDMMRDIGVSPNIKGYVYLRDAILMAVENRDMMNAVTKELYPAVARRHASTRSRVERAMRHAIEKAFDSGDRFTLINYFGMSADRGVRRPSNSIFISTLADRVLLAHCGRH